MKKKFDFVDYKYKLLRNNITKINNLYHMCNLTKHGFIYIYKYANDFILYNSFIYLNKIKNNLNKIL